MELRRELDSGSYRPGPFTTHRIFYPKSRLISAAHYRDRVVHHAIMNVLGPILDRRLCFGCFACRKGKGPHAAARHIQRHMAGSTYAWHADIKSFFPSIDHDLLKSKLAKLIKDERFLNLLGIVIDSSNPQDDAAWYFPGDNLFDPFARRRGLPIGNLTSQWLANWHLNSMDHLITTHLRHGRYARYCDDFVVLGQGVGELQDVRGKVVEHLQSIRLRLHPHKNMISPVKVGICFVGFRIWPNRMKVRRATIRRFFKRLRHMRELYEIGALTRADVRNRIHGFLGHLAPAFSNRFLPIVIRQWREFGIPFQNQTNSTQNQHHK